MLEGLKDIETWQRQNHTSQDHFCSLIDEFPVWNSEPVHPRWWVEQQFLSVKKGPTSKWGSAALMIAHSPINGEWKELVLSEWFSEGEDPLSNLNESFKYRMLVVNCLVICFCTLKNRDHFLVFLKHADLHFNFFSFC